MSHLTDHQLEDVLAGGTPLPAHLSECAACREKLAGHRAVRDRLRSAMASVRAPAGLAERIRGRTGAAESTAPRPSWRDLLTGWRRWTTLAAAAAMIVLAIGVGIHITSTDPATAALDELAQIHCHASGEDPSEFHSTADPAALEEYFQATLGFTPAVPRLGQGMAIRGCCKAHFRGKIVGSYVVDTPKGVISIIVVTDTPESMGMRRIAGPGGRDLWVGSFARCEMATIRLNGWSYSAVGEVPRSLLIDLLARLVPNGRK